ncbi:MAG: site-specific DNA-methyltransferase [Clostridia bacterium]
MELDQVPTRCERQLGEGAPGTFYLGDVVALLAELVQKYAGQVQTVYMDPPFLTGKKFSMRMKVGEKDWKAGTASLVQTAYMDNLEKDEYFRMMRAVLEAVHEMLSPTGLLFLHIDYRAHPHFRLMLDEIFGEENLLNEIVWAYQTGGRARKHFSRKHDTILFYRKGARYYFDLKSTGEVKPDTRTNHMKKHVDPDGRVYRSIRSGGKVYTYYDDDPVYPSDVWDDVSHLQQKDPQRTGYDTQKPLRLLERIIRCSSRPGDLVMDLFAGSGTTLEAAHALGRRFVGVDQSLLSLYVIRRRLCGAPVEYHAGDCPGAPIVSARALIGVGYYEVELTAFQMEKGVAVRVMSDFEALDNWSVGYLRDGAYCPLAQEWRARSAPALTLKLRLPVLTGTPVLRVGDVLGRYFYYGLDKDGMEI